MRTDFTTRRVKVLLFALLWLTYAYFYQSTHPNEAARFDQARAIIEQGVLYIDRYAFNTGDAVIVVSDGLRHVYPNKAPGTTILGVAPLAFWSNLLGLFGMQEQARWHLAVYLTILTTISLISTLAAVAMYSLLVDRTGNSMFSVLTVLAIWLGTICFPFSTVFFSHMQAAAQLVFAFWLIRKVGRGFARQEIAREREGKTERKRRLAKEAARARRLALVIGLLLGFTIATEYPTAILVGMLGLYFGALLLTSSAPRTLKYQIAVACGAGIILGVAPLFIYNMAVFSSPFFVPYQAYASEGMRSAFPGHRLGFVGVHWPGWVGFGNVLKEILIRPQRGLLYAEFEKGWVYALNPVLFLAAPGLVWMLFRRQDRAEALLVFVMTISYFIFNGCYGDSIVYWGGAWSVGPRHVIPVLPFLAMPLCESARRLWFLFIPLLLVSVFYMLLATAVEPRPSLEFRNPTKDLFVPNYVRGQFALNGLGLFDPPNRPHLDGTRATNFGKWAALPGRCQLIPLLILWFGVGTALFLAVAQEERHSAIKADTGNLGPAEKQEPNLGAGHEFRWWIPAVIIALYVIAIGLGPWIASI
jgi:hypothetical protein